MKELLVKFLVKNITPNYIDLAWELLDEKYWFENIIKNQPIKGFNVYYGESPESLFKINNEVIDGYSFRHITFNYDKFKNHYYKIEMVMENEVKYASPLMNIFPQMLKSALSIMRTHVFKLVATISEVVPTPVLFYQRRTSGVLCPLCGIDKKIGNIRSNCPTCLGTGYEGGYYKPVLAWVNSMAATNKDVSDQGVIKMQNSGKPVNTSSFFIVPKVNDFYRELTSPFRLYCVNSINQETESGNAPVSIVMTVTHEDSFHPLYSQKIPFIEELNKKIYWDRMYEQIDEIRNKIREIT